MNLAEADRIVETVSDALARCSGKTAGRLSWLRGITEESVTPALKLRLARTYLMDFRAADGRTAFEITKDAAPSIPSSIVTMFATDAEIEAAEALPKVLGEIGPQARLMSRHVGTPRDARAVELWDEIRRFATFCETLDRKDPLFWQRVFTEAGLPFEPDSFQG